MRLFFLRSALPFTRVSIGSDAETTGWAVAGGTNNTDEKRSLYDWTRGEFTRGPRPVSGEIPAFSPGEDVRRDPVRVPAAACRALPKRCRRPKKYNPGAYTCSRVVVGNCVHRPRARERIFNDLRSFSQNVLNCVIVSSFFCFCSRNSFLVLWKLQFYTVFFFF